jgi:hypothetical protein
MGHELRPLQCEPGRLGAVHADNDAPLIGWAGH